MLHVTKGRSGAGGLDWSRGRQAGTDLFPGNIALTSREKIPRDTASKNEGHLYQRSEIGMFSGNELCHSVILRD